MSQLLYSAICPHCRFNTTLLSTNVEEMIRTRQVPSTGDPFLMFVCQRCTKCFPWNYGLRQALGQADAWQRTEPVWISVVAKCEYPDCEALTELIAVRPHGTAKEEILAERPTWNVKDTYCEKGHQIRLPLDTKASHAPLA